MFSLDSLIKLDIIDKIVDGKRECFIEVNEDKHFRFVKSLEVEQSLELLEQIIGNFIETEKSPDILQQVVDAGDNKLKIGWIIVKNREFLYDALAIYFNVSRNELAELDLFDFVDVCYTLYVEYKDFLAERFQKREKKRKKNQK
ncbi:hypothetical protein NSS82_19040 [Paenibacillus sp. FSL H7-0735]|uniref:hypothetical protein n=1 Tax=Paenibacillus sp. FSL H7-0735 TaxID=2954736 RepID=UPI0030FAA40F